MDAIENYFCAKNGTHVDHLNMTNGNTVIDVDENETVSRNTLASSGTNDAATTQEEIKRVQREKSKTQNEIFRLTNKLDDLDKQLHHLTASLRVINAEKAVDWSSDQFPWTAKLKNVAETQFNIKEFRQNQLECMNAILSGYDAFLILPTGGGKSLCFQLPSMIWISGLTVVISPLVSLMTDQIRELLRLGVGCGMISSSEEKDNIRKTEGEMKKLQRKQDNTSICHSLLRILYVTPERFSKSKKFLASLEKIYDAGQLNLFVIDEVHCLSQWGHSFRTDYKFLSILKKQYEKIPILSLTATATHNVVTDITRILGLNNCQYFRSHSNRSNLFYMVCYKPKSASEVERLIADFVLSPSQISEAGIIYCISKKEAETLAQSLSRRFDISCAFYHGEMDARERKKIQKQWTEGNIRIVIATVAFGMGINKSNVRFVIHHSIPKSLENYSQEAGRAGRDSRQSICLILYRPSDVMRYSVMVFWETTGTSLLYNSVRYCTLKVDNKTSCRRSFQAHHFGDEAVQCNKSCDICLFRDTMRNVAGITTDKHAIDVNNRKKRLIDDSSNTKTNWNGLLQINEKNLQTLCVNLFTLVESSSKNEKKLTILQLSKELKKKMPKGERHLGSLKILCSNPKSEDALINCEPDYDNYTWTEKQVTADEEELQNIFVQLIIDGYLQESFYHTPYSTNSYCTLSSKGFEICASIKESRSLDSLYTYMKDIFAVTCSSEALAALYRFVFTKLEKQL